MKSLILLCLIGVGVGSPAVAQSLSPMRANVVTFGEVSAVRTSLRNPYTTARRFDIEVFDLDWQKVENAQLTRASLSLAPGANTSILAMVPVGEADERQVYVCATSRPFQRSSAGLRGQVCGRYRLIRRRL